MFSHSAAKTSPGEQSSEALLLRIFNDFAINVMSIPNANDLLWYVAQNVVGKLNFVDCVIYTSNLDETILTQAAALGDKNPFGRSIINPLKIPFGQGITGRVAQNREAVIVEDLLHDKSYIPDTKPARSEICVPMIFGNRVVGVIDSEHPEPGAFGQTELEILTTVAAMTSAKLELLEETERSARRYHDLVDAHTRLTREINNRKALEAQLFEARRLEAIGRLSGGFAHDFNNILTAVSGNLDILDEVISPRDPEVGECLAAARTASKKGAALVRSMLAFAQRAHLEAEVVDIRELVDSTLDWSKRVLPDSISVRIHLSERAWPTKIDRSAAENALLNLIVNARDAMPDGGRIDIRIENVSVMASDPEARMLQLEPGKFVRLSVSDTGTGIPEHQLQQIFDPFFTTKPAGEGTGLGLSTVFGFMQQSKGTVAVDSKIGEGSTFHLYFSAISPM
ncbi:ATP-binding protein [Poseidonocella sp. HB161398]|uniref:ATP-binding protein n=1 Tax=Poseidonocella sp. HB161398 TaxID=2320855 RepID=UPI001109FB42|nr:ATP-binding protein [Poseidonocella sp. HB161398]